MDNKKNLIIRTICFICCLCAFIYLLTNYALQDNIKYLDEKGYYYISTYLSSNVMTIFAKVISNCCHAITVISISIISLFLYKKYQIGRWIAYNLVIIFTLNYAIKNIIQRPRPSGYNLIIETGYSFPSAHSMVSMAFYGFILYLIYKYMNRKTKYIFMILLILLIGCIGISRIYLGVHYTSDVLGGFILSISYLIVYTTIYNSYIKKKEEE